MRGYSYYNIFRCYAKEEIEYMTLESIMRSLKNCDTFELKPGEPSISLITEKSFYIQPNYKELKPNNGKAKFIIFSASGATGKSALARHLAYTYKGIYWDLSKIRLGENSFHGTIVKAVGYDKLNNFFALLNSGKTVLLIDAFDEADVISGRIAIEFLLKDLDEITKDSVATTIILLSRTETAAFIADFCMKKNINYTHYEIGFFSEYNAESFIINKLKAAGTQVTTVTNECIKEQFSRIRRILDKPELADSFIGYAPVLEALAKAFDEERNTVKLLTSIRQGCTSTTIISSILQKLLQREKEKFCSGLKEKWRKEYSQFNDWDKLYTEEEQLIYVVEYIYFKEINIYFTNEDVPSYLAVEYKEAVLSFLPQHPFLQLFDENGKYDFTGPAFRDYSLAYMLSKKECTDLASEYFSTISGACPSQLLFDFYISFADSKISGENFPLVYDSYKAKETVNKRASIDIVKCQNDGYAFFKLFDDKNVLLSETELQVNSDTKKFIFKHLSNVDVEVDVEVFIGEGDNASRLYNSTVICNKIVWNSANILIEAAKPGGCLLVSKDDIISTRKNIKFDIHTDDNDDVKICFPNTKSYYKLIPYSYDFEKEEGDDLTKFIYSVKKITSSLRKHGKDVTARDSEFIRNVIVGNSKSKKNVLDFLIYIQLLYVDPKEDYLYKMDTSKLSEYGFSWEGLSKNEDKQKSLYLRYKEWGD